MSRGFARFRLDLMTTMNGTILTHLRKLAEDISAREGCYLYDLELIGSGGGRVLRVTIDKEAEGGVSIDDCSNVSRGLNLILDAEEDVVPGGQYELEVTSPGLERVLKEPRHYQAVIGKKISVKSFAPLLQFNETVSELGKAKQIQGQLVSFDDKGMIVTFESPGIKIPEGESPKHVFIPSDMVTKAHVVFEFEDAQAKKNALKPGGSKKGKPKK